MSLHGESSPWRLRHDRAIAPEETWCAPEKRQQDAVIPRTPYLPPWVQSRPSSTRSRPQPPLWVALCAGRPYDTNVMSQDIVDRCLRTS
jgi:hypothetical protein